jgi:hypothetical protein
MGEKHWTKRSKMSGEFMAQKKDEKFQEVGKVAWRGILIPSVGQKFPKVDF